MGEFPPHSKFHAEGEPDQRERIGRYVVSPKFGPKLAKSRLDIDLIFFPDSRPADPEPDSLPHDNRGPTPSLNITLHHANDGNTSLPPLPGSLLAFRPEPPRPQC